MDSIMLSNDEETTRIWLSEEQLSQIIAVKNSGAVCSILLAEGETKYEVNSADLFLIH